MIYRFYTNSQKSFITNVEDALYLKMQYNRNMTTCLSVSDSVKLTFDTRYILHKICKETTIFHTN